MSSGSYIIPYAGAQVSIDWHGEAARDIVKFLFTQRLAGTRVGERVEIVSDRAGHAGEILIRHGDFILYEGSRAGSAAIELMRWTIYELAADCYIGPLFHAAAFSFSGQGVLFPGMTGRGKSTLSAWLAHCGYNYLSDELACVPQGGLHMEAFARPLHLKGMSVSHLEALGSAPMAVAADPLESGLRTVNGRLIPVLKLNRHNLFERPLLDLIVFPRFEQGAPLRVEALSKADNSVELMENMINARNLAGHGLKEVTRLAKDVPAYRLTYSSFEGVNEELERLLRNTRSRAA